MQLFCDPCNLGSCQNKTVHWSKQAADIAYCNVVRARKYSENCKADVKAGREVEEELEYGTIDMEEGEAKEMAKAEGVALAPRFAAARETGTEKRKTGKAGGQNAGKIGCEPEEETDSETVKELGGRVNHHVWAMGSE